MQAQTTSLTWQERVAVRMGRVLPKLMGRLHLRVLRLTGGRLGSSVRGVPVGSITTTGRRTGLPRTVPLMYMRDAGRFLVLACNAGFDAPPAWLLNLQALPRATFEVDGQPLEVSARVLDQDERAELWPRLVDYNPVWGGYQDCTDRRVEVLELRPEAASHRADGRTPSMHSPA